MPTVDSQQQVAMYSNSAAPSTGGNTSSRGGGGGPHSRLDSPERHRGDGPHGMPNSYGRVGPGGGQQHPPPSPQQQYPPYGHPHQAPWMHGMGMYGRPPAPTHSYPPQQPLPDSSSSSKAPSGPPPLHHQQQQHPPQPPIHSSTPSSHYPPHMPPQQQHYTMPPPPGGGMYPPPHPTPPHGMAPLPHGQPYVGGGNGGGHPFMYGYGGPPPPQQQRPGVGPPPGVGGWGYGPYDLQQPPLHHSFGGYPPQQPQPHASSTQPPKGTNVPNTQQQQGGFLKQQQQQQRSQSQGNQRGQTSTQQQTQHEEKKTTTPSNQNMKGANKIHQNKAEPPSTSKNEEDIVLDATTEDLKQKHNVQATSGAPSSGGSSTSKVGNHPLSSTKAPIAIPSSSTTAVPSTDQNEIVDVERLKAQIATTELKLAEVKPIQSDFHFFVHEMRSTFLAAAEAEINALLQANGTEGQESNKKFSSLDLKRNKHQYAFVLNSNLNCRLLKAWEELNMDGRSEYAKYEEDDRRRFMDEDEVASRHCFTLTARVRSPSKNRTGTTTNETTTTTPPHPTTIQSQRGEEDEDRNHNEGDDFDDEDDDEEDEVRNNQRYEENEVNKVKKAAKELESSISTKKMKKIETPVSSSITTEATSTGSTDVHAISPPSLSRKKNNNDMDTIDPSSSSIAFGKKDNVVTPLTKKEENHHRTDVEGESAVDYDTNIALVVGEPSVSNVGVETPEKRESLVVVESSSPEKIAVVGDDVDHSNMKSNSGSNSKRSHDKSNELSGENEEETTTMVKKNRVNIE